MADDEGTQRDRVVDSIRHEKVLDGDSVRSSP